MENKEIRAIPRNGSWKDVYETIVSKKGSSTWIELRLTPRLLDNVGCYDGISRAWSLGYLEIEARLQKDMNVRLFRCIQQNYGDSDGFGVEPDDYMYGEVNPEGVFIKPFYVA